MNAIVTAIATAAATKTRFPFNQLSLLLLLLRDITQLSEHSKIAVTLPESRIWWKFHRCISWQVLARSDSPNVLGSWDNGRGRNRLTGLDIPLTSNAIV